MQLKERLFFTRYFAILLHAGLTIQQALHVLKDQLTSVLWKKILPGLEREVLSGHKLSEALAQFPKEFPDFYPKMLAVGEGSGNLAEVFSYLEKQLHKDYLLVSKVKRAFIYPVVILGILLSVSAGLLVFIVPRVARLFIQLKIELPLPTRLLLGVQQVVQDYGFFILAGLVALTILAKFLLKIYAIRFQLHRIVLHIPLAGKIIRNLNLARFAQMLATLLAGGVVLVNALNIASSTVSNLVFKKQILKAAEFVEKGGTLSGALCASPNVFPALMSHMINIGEKTGNLQQQAKELSSFYAHEVDSSVKTLSIMIEPILLVVVAGGVGSIALSIVLPLYQLPTAIHK